MNTSKEILIATRNVVAKGWTQNAMARNHKGWVVSPRDDFAMCWCADGAFQKAIGMPVYIPEEYFVARRKFADQVRFDMLMKNEHVTYEHEWDELCNWDGTAMNHWNDREDRTQEEVIEMFDKAIAAAA